MVKGYFTFALVIGFALCIKDIQADCACDAVCTGLEPFDRAACVDDGVEGETNGCNNYCECGVGGAATLMECPDFLGYDPITKSCIWQNDVENCGNGTTTSPDIEECDTTECTGTDVYNPMIRACVPVGTYVCDENPIPKCTVGSIYDKKYVSDKTSCSGYYYCDGNVRLKGSCDANLYYFNPLKQTCSYKTGFNCTVPGTESGSSGGIDWANICSGVVNSFVADPRVCKAYIYCNGESKPRQAFCADGKYFSNGRCVSSPPASCTCEIHDWSDVTTEDDVKYASSTDANKFYICTKGERTEEECFPGTIWNQEFESCVFA